MRFLITGCARSGTVFITHLLKGAGIACDHERIFNVEDCRDTWVHGGEVAWEAAPHIQWVLDQGIPVLHQVRHPLSVIASLMTYRLFNARLTSRGQTTSARTARRCTGVNWNKPPPTGSTGTACASCRGSSGTG